MLTDRPDVSANGAPGWKLNHRRTLVNTAHGFLRAYWPTQVFFPTETTDSAVFAAISNRPMASDIIGYLRWIDSL